MRARTLASMGPIGAFGSNLHASRSLLLPFLAPAIYARHASGVSITGKKGTSKKGEVRKKKKSRPEFKREDLRNAQQYSLCDAMRYLRAVEVGQAPTGVKYELAVSMRTYRNGPVVRNRMRLPHAVDTSQRIAVICAPKSQSAEEAKAAGAILVGEDSLLDAIKEGRIEFDQLLCHQDSAQTLNKAGVGKILGPRGLMPSNKTKTIVKDVGATVKGMIGGTEYREKIGVVRLAIGQLGFSPEQLQTNIKAFMASVKRDVDVLSDNLTKEIHEIVLSSTNGPGFSLNGYFRSETSPSPEELNVW